MIRYSELLNLKGGILVTNPIPAEYEIPHEKSMPLSIKRFVKRTKKVFTERQHTILISENR